MLDRFDEIDLEDLSLQETIFVRDIDTSVFKSIIIKSVSLIKDIVLLDEVTLFDNILGRDGVEKIKGVYVDQDSKNNSINIKLHLDIVYGIPIPDKAEEIREKIIKEITDITGLRVSCIHLVFKHLIDRNINAKDLV